MLMILKYFVKIDNQQIKSVAMEISTIVGDSASWETLETVETTGQAEFALDSTRYNVDTLYVRFLAEDASGNTAYSKLTYTFPVDNTPPEIVSSITGEASATSITLHWTYDAPSDFSHFTLEKQDGSGTYAKVGGNLTSLGAQINNLTPGTEYKFSGYGVRYSWKPQRIFGGIQRHDIRRYRCAGYHGYVAEAGTLQGLNSVAVYRCG